MIFQEFLSLDSTSLSLVGETPARAYSYWHCSLLRRPEVAGFDQACLDNKPYLLANTLKPVDVSPKRKRKEHAASVVSLNRISQVLEITAKVQPGSQEFLKAIRANNTYSYPLSISLSGGISGMDYPSMSSLFVSYAPTQHKRPPLIIGIFVYIMYLNKLKPL